MRSLLVLLVLFAQAPFAQAPAEKAPAPEPKAVLQLDEDEKALWGLVKTMEEIATAECQKLDSVRKFNTAVVETSKRIEARHNGLYRFDQQAVQLVLKKAKP